MAVQGGQDGATYAGEGEEGGADPAVVEPGRGGLGEELEDAEDCTSPIEESGWLVLVSAVSKVGLCAVPTEEKVCGEAAFTKADRPVAVELLGCGVLELSGDMMISRERVADVLLTGTAAMIVFAAAMEELLDPVDAAVRDVLEVAEEGENEEEDG